jgi:AcrR family transcriptional regulator
VRTHGWGGSPPATDDEARDLLVQAATRCVDRLGTRTTLSDVAREAGVTRPTVYRYFNGPEELFQAMSLAAAAGYIDRLIRRVRDLTDPLDVVVEVIVYCADTLPREPHVGFLMRTHAGTFAVGAISDLARTAAISTLLQLPVDWEALGHDETTLGQLAELMLRLLLSYLVDPDPDPELPPDRAALRRWLFGALHPAEVSTR